MYQEWIKGRSLTSTNQAELMEKEALEMERKEGNEEKFDLGEQSRCGLWSAQLSQMQTSLLQSHTFSPLCFDLPRRLMSCFWRGTSFSRAEVTTNSLSALYAAFSPTCTKPVNPLPGTACFYWKTCSHLEVQVWHLS